MICVQCQQEQNDLETNMAKLPAQYLLCRLPNGIYCMVDAMATTAIPDQKQLALVLKKVSGSEAPNALGAVLKTIEILAKGASCES